MITFCYLLIQHSQMTPMIYYQALSFLKKQNNNNNFHISPFFDYQMEGKHYKRVDGCVSL